MYDLLIMYWFHTFPLQYFPGVLFFLCLYENSATLLYLATMDDRRIPFQGNLLPSWKGGGVTISRIYHKILVCRL